jgi:hypothetical protein
MQIIFKYLVLTSKKTQRFTSTKINWLTLCREIIAVYSENHTKPINTLCDQNAEFPTKVSNCLKPLHELIHTLFYPRSDIMEILPPK